MNGDRLVGVHLATSGVQAAVYAQDGERLDSGETDLGEQTTVAWERAVREAVPDVSDTGICSVASTSGTAVLVDEFGEPVFSPAMYYDAAPDYARRLTELNALEGVSGQHIASSPTSPLAKILRCREEYPDRFDSVEWVLSPTTWLLYRLNYGSSTRWRDVETDWTNALKFGADITTPVPEWFDSLFEATGLPRSLFPTIRPPGSYIGVAEGEFATRTGLDGLKLFQGLTDGNASVLANRGLEPGDFSVTFGAASVMKYVSESITPHEALYYHRHPLEGYLPGAAFDSGNVLRWFLERVLDRTETRGLELAESVPPGEEYEVLLQGNRSPFFDPSIGSSILGLQHDTSLSTEEIHGRIARGLATGIVLAEYAYVSLVEDHFDTSIDRVRLMNDGPPNRGDGYDWWNTVRASVWDRPVVEMEPRTTVGPLIPPTLITSIYSDADEAADKLLRERAIVDPDPTTGDIYETRKDRYLDRWQSVADLYTTD